MASRHAKIWKALKDHLGAYPGLPATVVYGGQSFDDPDPTLPYMIVDDVRFDPSGVYWEGVEWHTGSLAVHCMIPLQWTDLQSAEFAGALCDYFAPDAVMEYDGSLPYLGRAIVMGLISGCRVWFIGRGGVNLEVAAYASSV